MPCVSVFAGSGARRQAHVLPGRYAAFHPDGMP